jgi:hypothetical protein
VILVDSNVPMYLIGADDEQRDRARRALEEAVAAAEAMCTDAEVLQEILHRFRAIRREASIDAAFDAVIGVVDVVYPIEQADVERARRLLRTTDRLSARDALHVAVMQGRDIDRILSFDAGFDGIPGIVRLA